MNGCLSKKIITALVVLSSKILQLVDNCVSSSENMKIKQVKEKIGVSKVSWQ